MFSIFLGDYLGGFYIICIFGKGSTVIRKRTL